MRNECFGTTMFDTERLALVAMAEQTVQEFGRQLQCLENLTGIVTAKNQDLSLSILQSDTGVLLSAHLSERLARGQAHQIWPQ